jgi:von Willebrand factor type A domain
MSKMKRVTFSEKVTFVEPAVPCGLSSDEIISYTKHAEERCVQRNIGSLEILHALQRGVPSKGSPRSNGNPTTIYTSESSRVVCIVDDIKGAIVTTYTLPENLEEVFVTKEEIIEHESTKREMQQNPNQWKSYSVVLVDTSGSMKASDVKGSRTRLEAVWKALANDYILQRIEQGTGGCKDAVSILSLGSTCKTLLLEEPTTLVLYNKICRLQPDKTAQPFGHGNYLPSLDTAEMLLNKRRSSSSCVANLVLLSDGRPSDNQMLRASLETSWNAIENRVLNIAKQFGCRLNFSAIGMGNPGDFQMLQRMVYAAKDYGAQATFYLPSKTSAALGTSFTASATALSTLQTDMMDESHTAEIRAILDVEHESRQLAQTIPNCIVRDDFHVFPLQHVRREM